MEEMEGRWRFDRSKDEGVTEFLTATGVSESTQKYLLESDPLFQWQMVGDKIKVTYVIGNCPPKCYQYRLGQEFLMEKAADLRYKCVVTWDGSSLVESFSGCQGEGHTFTTKRRVHGDFMTVVSK